MSDISKINVSGVSYDIKDAVVRQQVNQLSEEKADKADAFSTEAKALLIDILKVASFSTDVSESIGALRIALGFSPDYPVFEGYKHIKTITSDEILTGNGLCLFSPYYYENPIRSCYPGFDILTEFGDEYLFYMVEKVTGTIKMAAHMYSADAKTYAESDAEIPANLIFDNGWFTSNPGLLSTTAAYAGCARLIFGRIDNGDMSADDITAVHVYRKEV